MRKVSYFNFDYYKARHDVDMIEDERLFKTHIGKSISKLSSHCISIVLTEDKRSLC